MPLLDQQIIVLACDIWRTVLGLTIVPSPELVTVDAPALMLTGSVEIQGAWQGAVHVQCSPEFARRAASLMFGVTASEVGCSEARDSLGELTNMVSGNLKSLLPGPSSLSIPVIAERPVETIRPGAVLESQVCMTCDEHSIVVSVVSSGKLPLGL